MSHDRGCFKCNRDRWEYIDCPNKDDCPKRSLVEEDKTSLSLNGIEPPTLNGEGAGSNPVGKTIFKKELTYNCPNNVRETDPYRAAAWYLREASVYHDNMMGARHRLDFTHALWVVENADKVREIFDALDEEVDK